MFALNHYLGGRFFTTRHIKGAHVGPKIINRQEKENTENYLNVGGTEYVINIVNLYQNYKYVYSIT